MTTYDLKGGITDNFNKTNPFKTFRMLKELMRQKGKWDDHFTLKRE